MIRIRNLRKSFGKLEVLRGIDLDVARGEVVALIGPSGSGKSTLLRCVNLLEQPTAGSIAVDGQEITAPGFDVNRLRQRVGMVFQNPDDQLFMPMIYDDVAFGPRNFGLSEEEVQKRVDSALAELGITHLRNRSSLKLSGGEKRMAAIATVLSMDPTTMIFDEPTAFLDPKARRNLIKVLSALPHSKLIATHDLTFAEEVCPRAILIKKGRIFADGETHTLLRDEKLMDDCGIEAIR